MEVLQTDSHFIFVQKDKTLWWNRHNQEFTCKKGETRFSFVVMVHFYRKGNKN